MKKILSALTYCHARKIVHRDIKPENLLMGTPAKESNLKVVDFGTSRVFSDEKMKGIIGTPFYIAPEVLRYSYTEKCDIWSCGVILYVLLSGSKPFIGTNCFETMEKIKRGSFTMTGKRWNEVSDQAKDFLKKMMAFIPSHRFSAVEALNHPWIVSHTQQKIDLTAEKILLNDLTAFTAEHKLQQAALTYIVSQLVSNKEKEELQNIFMKLDKDGNGRLSEEELIEGYKEIFGENYPAEEEVKRILAKIDIDNNGYIELSEFIMATIDKDKALSRERLVTAFNMFDRVLFYNKYRIAMDRYLLMK